MNTLVIQEARDLARHLANKSLPEEANRALALSESIAKLVQHIADHDAGFQLRWDASQRATKRWQEANPGNDLVWPDHTDLCVWLMEQHKELSDRLTEAEHAVAARTIELSEAREQLTSRTIEAAALRSEIAQLKSDHGEEVTSLNAEISDLKFAVKDRNTEIGKINAEIVSLREARDFAEARAAELNVVIDKLQTQIDKLEADAEVIAKAAINV